MTEDQVWNLIESSIGTGKVVRFRDGSYREFIKYGETIGKYVDYSTKAISSTSNFMIHYSKDGIHAYPYDPKMRDLK